MARADPRVAQDVKTPRRTFRAAGRFYVSVARGHDGSDQFPTVATKASDITIDRLFTDGSQTAHWW